MAGSSSTALSVLSPPHSVPKTGSSKTDPCETRVSVSMRRNPRSISFGFGAESQGKRGSTRLNAVGLTEIEPDINEDPKDRWATNGVSAEDFLYGEYDGAHTYHGEDEEGKHLFPDSGSEHHFGWCLLPNWAKMTLQFLELFGDMSQKIMQRLNPLRVSRVSTIIADNSICLSNYNYHVCLIWFSSISNRVYFMAIPPSNHCWHVFPCSGNDTNNGEYLYIGAAVFTVVFCIIEMNKPSEPHNFEPQIYNMERGARDKLIADYNTMDLWDFNEKYGDLWDFTVKKDAAEIMRR
ncbi:hypothetical protein RHMOL_Rhmol04G0320700 [Rhododendron molle]|uniref:Uncharacterized protein n=1 Tax=Rhododendron molle TaxID=49168 RepID=A0ACC0P878_RHOML|nr:hypothetical protein RHMOL_Rhmol04G0320700 [Rhododendron molle]